MDKPIRKKTSLKLFAPSVVHLAYAAVICLLCFIFGFAIFEANKQSNKRQRNIYLSQIQRHAFTIKEALSKQLTTILSAGETIADGTLAGYTLGQRTRQEALYDLNNIQSIFPSIRCIALSSRAGQIDIMTPPKASLVSPAAQVRDWTQSSWGTLALGSSLYVPKFAELGELQTMGMLLPVMAKGEMQGILTILVDFKQLAQHFNALTNPEKHSNCTLLSQDGTLLYCQLDQLTGQNVTSPKSVATPRIAELARHVVISPSGTDLFSLPPSIAPLNPDRLLAWDSVRIGNRRIIVACTAPASIPAAPLTEQRILYSLIGFFFTALLICALLCKSSHMKQRIRHAAYKRMLKVIELVPDPTFAIDNSGKVIAWNNSLTELTGVSAKEVVGRGNHTHGKILFGTRRPLLVDLFGRPPHEIERLYDLVERVGDVIQVETFVPTIHSGIGGHVVGTASELFDEEGHRLGAIETLRDISRLKRTEKRLRTSEERYALAVAGANDGIWDWDIHKDTFYFSLRWKEILGLSGHSIQPHIDEWKRRIHPDDEQKVIAAINSIACREQENFEVEYRLRHSDGGYRWVQTRGRGLVDKNGNVYRMAGAISDITQRKHEEAISSILLAISGAVHATRDLDDLFATVHSILLHHIDASNFFIAMVDDKREQISFPYFRDEQEGDYAEPLAFGDTATRSLTLDIIRAETPFMYSGTEIDRIGALGPPAQQWLGTPLKVQDKVIGAMAVQHYYDAHHYTKRDLDLLVSVSEQVAMAIERKITQEQLAHLAIHDSLTGLPNRFLFEERLNRALARTHRDAGHQFAVLMLDLDDFKLVNDSHGHQTGDKLLLHIALKLGAMLRETDTMARLGGDEFAILIEGFRRPREVTHVVRRLQKASKEPLIIGEHELHPSASIGVVLHGNEYSSPQNLMRDADIAMYQSKRRGKGHFRVFNMAMRKQAVHAMTLENSLRAAVRRNEFTLAYQPIFRTWDQKLAGFEALLRWNHPEYGPVSPADFIPAAENSGLIIPIGKFVLSEACRNMTRWMQCYPDCRDLSICVNLSAKQTAHPNIVGQVRRTLARTGLTARNLTLEITETAVMEAPDISRTILSRLHDLGARIALDDFGTGQSSLSYLHTFPADVVKLDKSFTDTLDTATPSVEFISAIISLAHAMRLDVVVEGVETAQQLANLRSLSCEYVQGFHLGRPITAAEVDTYLQNIFSKTTATA